MLEGCRPMTSQESWDNKHFNRGVCTMLGFRTHAHSVKSLCARFIRFQETCYTHSIPLHILPVPRPHPQEGKGLGILEVFLVLHTNTHHHRIVELTEPRISDNVHIVHTLFLCVCVARSGSGLLIRSLQAPSVTQA